MDHLVLRNVLIFIYGWFLFSFQTFLPFLVDLGLRFSLTLVPQLSFVDSEQTLQDPQHLSIKVLPFILFYISI